MGKKGGVFGFLATVVGAALAIDWGAMVQSVSVTIGAVVVGVGTVLQLVSDAVQKEKREG